MHFHFPFTLVGVFWTLTFAAHLVLLIVLLGRDRAGRFPLFTASIAVGAIRLLISQLLGNRLPQMLFVEILLVTLAVGVVLGLLVLLELARHAFGRVQRSTWVIGALTLMMLGAAALWFWGPWPHFADVKEGSTWQLLQLIVQKGSRLVDIETILLGLLVAIAGAKFGAGWRSHTQRILIGLSTASITQLGLQATWEAIVRSVRANPSLIRSMADQNRVEGLGEKLSNANTTVFLAVLVWWIVCLWMDEPGTTKTATSIEATSDAPALEPGTDTLVTEPDEETDE